MSDQVEETVSIIPLSRKRKADSLFAEMVSQENKDIGALMSKTVSHQKQSKQSNSKRKKKEKLQDVSI